MHAAHRQPTLTRSLGDRLIAMHAVTTDRARPVPPAPRLDQAVASHAGKDLSLGRGGFKYVAALELATPDAAACKNAGELLTDDLIDAIAVDGVALVVGSVKPNQY